MGEDCAACGAFPIGLPATCLRAARIHSQVAVSKRQSQGDSSDMETDADRQIDTDSEKQTDSDSVRQTEQNQKERHTNGY
jgi:hypothetical protein